MNVNPLDVLQQKLSSNQAKIANLESQIKDAYSSIELANKQKSALDHENLSIKYCLDLVQPAEEKTEPTKTEDVNSSKIPLRVTVLGLFSTDDPMSVTDVYEKTKQLNILASKATINTTLHAMAKKGILEKVSLGVYKKVG